MRRYTGRPAAVAAVTGSASDPEAGEPLDHHPLARLGVREIDEILDRRLAAGVLDERLLEQALIGEELLELALDDLVEHLRRLLLVRHLAPVDLALLLEHGGRYVLARHVGRVGGGHLHRQIADELAEAVGLGHEVGLAVHLDQGAQLAVRMQVGVHEAFLGLAARPLLGVGEALLPQILGGGVEVAVAGGERGLAVHHAGARALAQLHHGLGVGGHQETSASAAAISLSSSPSPVSAALSSLPSVPRPSLTASAIRDVMRRTARMASSLPGIA